MNRKYVAVLLALLLVAAPGFASTASNTVAVPVLLSIPESISLTLSSNSITLSNAAPSQNVTLTASWQILPNTHTTATIYSFFTAVPTSGSLQILSSHFSTKYNTGAAVICSQPAFPVGTIGNPGQNCGSFAIPVNVATDVNDSQAVTLTVAADAAVFNGSIPVGSYTGGVLDIVFQIV